MDDWSTPTQPHPAFRTPVVGGDESAAHWLDTPIWVLSLLQVFGHVASICAKQPEKVYAGGGL